MFQHPIVGVIGNIPFSRNLLRMMLSEVLESAGYVSSETALAAFIDDLTLVSTAEASTSINDNWGESPIDGWNDWSVSSPVVEGPDYVSPQGSEQGEDSQSIIAAPIDELDEFVAENSADGDEAVAENIPGNDVPEQQNVDEAALQNIIEEAAQFDDGDVEEAAAIIAGGAAEATNHLILEMFLCPICNRLIYPEYRQCDFSHSLCGRCYNILRECPFDRQPFGDWRNRMLERIACSIAFPCYFYQEGCTALLPGSVWDDHVNECSFSNVPKDNPNA